MTDRPPADDWWQAADGSWYPPEARTGADNDREPRMPGLSRGVAAAAPAALFSSAAMGGVAALSMAAESSSFDADQVRSALTISDALGFAGTMFGVWSMAALGASILLIVWLHQAYRSVEGRGATGTRWSPGWAVGGWFIPFANFVLPKLVANEVDRLSHPDVGADPIGARWKTIGVMMVGHWWWALTIAGGVVLALGFGVVAEQLDSFSLVEQTYRAGLQATAAGVGLWAGGAAAAGVMVGRISRRLIEAPAIESF